MKIRQLWDTTWIRTGEYEYDICCRCGLTHKVEYRWNSKKHQLEEKWSVVPDKKLRKPRAKRQ